MNKKFLSAILFGALMLTSTGTFVSCKDYDDDIDEINVTLNDLKSQLTALQTKVDAGKWITAVSSVTGGFTVTFSDGSSYTITNGKDGAVGEAGAAGTQWTISEDGFWVCDGERTTVKAVGQDGAKGEDAQPEVMKENGKWYLWNGTEFEEITVEATTAANVPYYYVNPNDNNYAILVVTDKDGKNAKEISLPLNEGLAQIAILNSSKNLDVYYTIAGEIKWDGAKAAPAKGGYLMTQSTDSLLVQVTPTSYDLAAIKSFSLVNSLNEAAPVTVDAPVAFNQVLESRAASKGGLYKLAVKANPISDEIVEAYNSSSPYLALLATEKVRSAYEMKYRLIDAASYSTTIEFRSNMTMNNVPYFTTEPGKDLTIKASRGAEYLYDAYLVVDASEKADSIKWGISTDKTMTIKSTDKAQGIMYFTVRYLDVKGQVGTQQIVVNFGKDSEEEVISTIATTPHVATSAANKNFMLVDFAPYFDKMTEAERILWNADANCNTSNTYYVDWTYTDETTGREKTETWMYGLINNVEWADAKGAVTTDKSKYAYLKITFDANYGVNNNFALGNGTYTTKLYIYGAKENVTQVVEIPFTIANPTAAEIAGTYAFNPASFKDNTLTVLDATTVKVSDHLTKGALDFSAAKYDDKSISVVADGTVTLLDAKNMGKSYTISKVKTALLGRQYEVSLNVVFATSKSYVFTLPKALSVACAGANTIAVKYGDLVKDDSYTYNYKLTNFAGVLVNAADIQTVEFFGDKNYTEAVSKLSITPDASFNLTIKSTGDKIANDITTTVYVKFTLASGEEVKKSFTVTITGAL